MIFGLLLPFVIGYAAAWFITRRMTHKLKEYISFPLAMVLAILGTWVFATALGPLLWTPEVQDRVISMSFWIGPFAAALPILTRPRLE